MPSSAGKLREAVWTFRPFRREASAASSVLDPTVTRTEGGAAPATSSRGLGSGDREVFLDAIRAIAIIRVIAWHAFGLATITYFVSAIPAMFFVTGSLLAKSMARRDAKTVLIDRFRRLLVPLWAFGLVAWVAMAIAAWHSGTDLPLHRALAWIFPVVDPHGTAWEGGWLSSHLWYLRTVTWLLLASPLLIRAVRSRPVVTFATPIAAVFALDLLGRQGEVFPLGPATWAVGDLALYSIFLLAGFLHRDGAFRKVSRRGWAVVAVLAGLAAVAWRLTQPVPLGVVNNSHPLHLFVGAGWLAAALAAHPALTRLASSPLAGGVIRAIGRRALTIYLWHTAVIILAVNLLEARQIDDPVAHAMGLILLTVLGIAVAVRLFGWIEDLAARRRRTAVAVPGPARPRPAAEGAALRIATLAVLVTVTVGLVITSGSDPSVPSADAASAAPPRRSHRPPIPSKAPPAPNFRQEGPVAREPQELTSAEKNELVRRLDGLFEDWANETGVTAAIAGVALGPDVRWTGALGRHPDTDRILTPRDPVELASLTKLFTTALVHRYADAGLIDLTGPLPELASLPDFPYEYGITIPQLLDHSSGLANYRDSQRYLEAPSSVDSAAAAVMASAMDPLLAMPGERYIYSSTNYLLLGLLLEEVTGQSFDDLLKENFVMPLGLRDTYNMPAAPGDPRTGTAGIVTNLRDLLTAGVAILRDHRGISDEAYSSMTTIDPETSYGLGTFGFCPCRLDEYWNPQFFGIGYFGATTLLAYAPSLDLTIAVDLHSWTGEDNYFASVPRLFEMLEELIQNS